MNEEPKQDCDFLKCQNGLGAHRACLDSAKQVFLSLKILASKAIEPSGLQLLQIIEDSATELFASEEQHPNMDIIYQAAYW